MKNLVKQLPWKQFDNGLGVSANVGTSLTYYAYKNRLEQPFFKACLEGEEYDAWIREFPTLDEAIKACDEHYFGLISNGISPEARAILEQHLNPQTPTT